MFGTHRPAPDRHRNVARWLLAGLLLISGCALAEVGLRGPVTITADEVDWQNNQRMEYRGNVTLQSEGFRLTGDRLRLEQRPAGLYVEVDGNPAQMNQDELRDQGPVAARSQQLVYDASTQWVDLTGDAQLKRGRDQIEGRTIRYNLSERRVQARRDGGGQQVRIVIDNESLPINRNGTPPEAPAP